MTANPPLVRSLAADLFDAGIAVGLPAPRAQVVLHAGSEATRVRLELASGDLDAVTRVAQQHGATVTRDGSHLVVELGPPSAEPLMAFDLPLRLPTLNPQLRMHYAIKSRELVALAWQVTAALPRGARPARPLSNIEIEIDRYCTNRPDKENLEASSKWLLDVLQPMHPAHRPYGLGVIQEDATWCLRDVRLRHVPSRKRLTRVRIYPSSLPPEDRRATR